MCRVRLLAISLPLLLCAVSGTASRAAEDLEQAVVELVNQERNTRALAPLKRVDLLDASAGTHSDNMALRDFFDHCDLDQNTSPFQRMIAAGYDWNAAAENIAAGQGTSAAVMSAWMGSDGHRNNILSASYRETGVGHMNQSGDTAVCAGIFTMIAWPTPPTAAPTGITAPITSGAGAMFIPWSSTGRQSRRIPGTSAFMSTDQAGRRTCD